MEIHLKISKKLFTLILIIIIGISLFFVKTQISSAEQNGSSPESSSTSRMKTVYDALQSAGYGSDSDTPDWGANWNRIKTAANWVPTGDASSTDVRTGKTFFNTTRSAQTGTMVAGAPCSTQVFGENLASATPVNNCNLTWLTAEPSVIGDDKQDPRTGLVWSYGIKNNSGTAEFTASTLSGFTWTAVGANNIAVGNKTAPELCNERGDGWRLPSQKEYLQAFVDGAYFNLSNSTATHFWSNTASNVGGTAAFAVFLGTGYARDIVKTEPSFLVRCVREP